MAHPARTSPLTGRTRRARLRAGAAAALAGLLGGLVVLPAATAAAVDGSETRASEIAHGWTVPGEVWQGDFADPSVVRVGDTYYAYATNTAGRYVPALVSTDLVTWRARPTYSQAGPPGTPGYSVAADPAVPAEFRAQPWSDWDKYHNNDVLVQPASWGLKTSDGPWVRTEYWAPSAFQIGSTWYLYSAVRVGPTRFCLTVATGPGPLGPFRDDSTGPLQCQPVASDPDGSIDPAAYHDPVTGKDHLLWKALGKVGSHPSAIMSVELGGDGRPRPGAPWTTLLTTHEGGWEGTTIENPSMVSYGGTTYLFYSANHWGTTDGAGRSRYATGYAICPRGPSGPCTRPDERPLLSSSGTAQGPGGSAAFLDAQGRLRIASATYFLGEDRVGEAIRHPRRLSIGTLTRAADGRLSVVPGTAPVGAWTPEAAPPRAPSAAPAPRPPATRAPAKPAKKPAAKKPAAKKPAAKKPAAKKPAAKKPAAKGPAANR
ncbi:family 43 glycosylhydrolase [Quadrisphaera sp. KR29]|uniref:family 43 glycosylhydrolase n=1 Tax=Quadrisphaera sp. KR29 TaxID=3461391 RepID=UPI004044FFA7